MQIRQIRPGDGPVLQRVRLRALQDAPEAFTNTYEHEARLEADYWQTQAERQSSSNDATTFLLYHHDEVLGMIGAFFEHANRHQAFICAMWVAPAHRRSGAGARLVDTAARWLAERGAPQILAWVAEDNETALRFYENLGFLPTGARGAMPQRPEQKECLLALDSGMVRELQTQYAG